MIPLFLDPARCRIALVGRGRLAIRRLNWLHSAGADPTVFSDTPDAALVDLAGSRLEWRLPHSDELSSMHALWIADLDAHAATDVYESARQARVLVNVEDVKDQCDFHTPAVVHRGRLTLAAGTGGASPAVAAAVRERLDSAFPETWASALEEIADARQTLLSAGADPKAIIADALDRLKKFGL